MSDDIDRNKKGQFVKGGKNKHNFKNSPQYINGGRWDEEKSISFQYKKLIRMTPGQFRRWEIDHKENERTVAQEIAHKAVEKARDDLAYLKEVTDRTEGKAPQKQELDVVIENREFDDQQSEKVARRIARRKKGDDNSPGEEESN